jgi:hypothetical protein
MSETIEPVAQTTTETPQGSVDPENKGILHDLQTKRAELRVVKEELAAIKTANEEAETARLAEQNKFEELYNSEKAKVAELEPKVSEYEAINEAKKAVLLEKLGDDADDFKGLGIPALEKVVERLTKKETMPTEPGIPGTTTKQGYEAFSYSELATAIQRGDVKARAELDRRNKEMTR